MKKIILLFLAFTINIIVSGQSGYIYVHKKAVEVSSVNFPFTLSQGASTIKSFSLNDMPDALNAFDLGNSHGAGEGQIWAVINDANDSGVTHTVTGTLYTRAQNSQSWGLTGASVSNARSVDGINANSAVYTTDTGNVVIYNNNNTLSTIWTPGAHGNVSMIDIGSGGTAGVIAGVGSDGRIYKYTGTGTNDSWAVFSNVTVANATRIDVNPTNQEIVFIRSTDQLVYRLASANVATAPTTIAAPTGTTSAGNAIRDIAISNNGTIYSNYSNSIGSANIFEYTSAWTDNPTSRSFSGITAGVDNQIWAINKVNANIIKHSIFTRTSSGLYLDDERVRTSVADGNSIMIPVTAGTYTLTETATTGWINSEILLYDPTNNSTRNVLTSTSTINVSAGEVVHVVYTNALKNQIVTPANCGTNYIVTFGNGSTVFGPPFQGFTSYHYFPSGILSDGYYSLVKNTADWYTGGNLSLVNHTPTNTSLPANPTTNPPDPNGYFGIFNAAYATDDFFRQTVTGLVVGNSYEFGFWVADLSPQADIRPNVTMGIDDQSGGLLNSINTGDITAVNWVQYTFTFVATSTTGEIFLKNNSIGGSGNDLAIDDITLLPLPPPLSSSSASNGVVFLCSNNARSYQFVNGTAGGVWSTDTPSLITVNPTTGVATTVVGAAGIANIIYTFSSATGCSGATTLSIPVGLCPDTDEDGVINSVDLDNDNDGILDSVEGRCFVTSDPITDGFDTAFTPVTVNGNNIKTGPTYNGWSATGVTDPFNIINVNGAGYLFGPDNAHSGNQYVDINAVGAIIYKEFVLSAPTVVSTSAWFSNRAADDAGFTPWTTRIEILNTVTNALYQGNLLTFPKDVSIKNTWYESSISNVALPPGTYRIRMNVANYGHVDTISYCFSNDTDGDGIPDYLDLDSDNDGCLDAIEGSASIINSQLVTAAGTVTVGTGSTALNQNLCASSTCVNSLGLPQLSSPADYNNTTGQGIGSAANAAINSCICYNDPNTGTVGVDTKHGITLLKKAGADNGNWPMVRKSAHTVLESNTKGFVITRMTTAQVNSIVSPQDGMMVYDTTLNCLKLYDGTAWSCFNTPTCP